MRVIIERSKSSNKPTNKSNDKICKMSSFVESSVSHMNWQKISSNYTVIIMLIMRLRNIKRCKWKIIMIANVILNMNKTVISFSNKRHRQIQEHQYNKKENNKTNMFKKKSKLKQMNTKGRVRLIVMNCHTSDANWCTSYFINSTHQILHLSPKCPMHSCTHCCNSFMMFQINYKKCLTHV